MVWARLKYSKKEINWAGKMLTENHSSKEDIEKAFEILENWRAVHAYPLHVFQITLKRKASKFDREALISQRLKRAPAIIYKLTRIYHGRSRASMKLFQMQDIGGCRAVMKDLASARKLYVDGYLRGDLKHRLINKKNYVDVKNEKERIDGPKSDGYRGFHLVYAYKTPRGMKRYNNLLTEIQIRTKLQHLWATAVETAGFFTRQAIKSNEAEQPWLDFFRLMSSVFAQMENCPSVPNTPEDERELYLKIKEKEKELNFIEKMTNWAKVIPHIDRQIKTKGKGQAKFFLLELDILRKTTRITTFTEKEEKTAIEKYSELEKSYPVGKDYDIVLVGAENTTDLEKAYPSYFLDTEEFLKHLKEIVSKYNN
ncbi:RelA/SpoT domain-containing protein [Candidatus Pacearchaeota archaeon]|nr:RelA/SpoT domain-containing protein [Candidatus Pacearchaeota archaeon]